MKRVKITNGLYGYRPEGAKHPRPVSAGGLCVVTDTEAARLASSAWASSSRTSPRKIPQEPLQRP